MSSSTPCAYCGTTNPHCFRKTETYHYLEGICSDCSSKKKSLTEWRKLLEVSVDEIMRDPDLNEVCYKLYNRIQAKKERNWPNEGGFEISLHEPAFLHIHNLIGGLPGEGLTGTLNNYMEDFWQILSALKMAGFDEAYAMLGPSDGGLDPDSVNEVALEAALPLDRLVEFVRTNRELFE